MRNVLLTALCCGAIVCLTACEREAPSPQPEPASPPVTQTEPRARTQAAAVNAERLVQADNEPGNWMSHGRTYSEQRFSPLDRINESNVATLGLAWYHDLDTKLGQEATPIVVDGVMYVSTDLSKVKALNAATGEVLWSFDPRVPGEWLPHVCCGFVNRGVAAWNGKLFVGTLDGRLIALDAASGQPVWEQQTTDKSKPYSITGAPRVIKGKVIIGNGGAEFGVRGYVSAYDAETGAQRWRFYTVPGNPADGFESPVLQQAAQTWSGQWWQQGGGGTVWDGMAYDPELDLLYIGVGNGAPWNHQQRSNGQGDNLFLSSIVALRPETGEYVWHYQETPGETWDYTATQPIILADVMLGDQLRKVLLHAPKNGFFFVIDRATGELLSAEPFATVTWASGYDLDTGRPIENPNARYAQGHKATLVLPGPFGAHNWHPMSFSPITGLAYIPAQHMPFVYLTDDAGPAALSMNTGVRLDSNAPDPADKVNPDLLVAKGSLLAWDPVAQRAAWQVEHSGPWNGGVLSTAGNLVFQGTAAGEFAAYRASNGERLWGMDPQTGVVAGPMSYSVGDEQYIAVAAGWGGVFGLFAPSGQPQNINRILAFKLGGSATLPPTTPAPERTLAPPPRSGTAESIAEGKDLYFRFCSRCHGPDAAPGPILPDLRYSATLGTDAWFAIAYDGTLASRGMVGFSRDLTRENLGAIRDYVIGMANDAVETAARAEQAAATP
jgi:PQQ-dependent dehydrogenase (methanol/ethanol family)